MTKEDLKAYIIQNGNQETVLNTIRQMHAENAPMTIEELDRRMHQDSFTVNTEPTSIDISNEVDCRADKSIKPSKPSVLDVEKDYKGSTVLTVIAVALMFIMLALLAVILILQVAPDSEIAIAIDTFIEKVTRLHG